MNTPLFSLGPRHAFRLLALAFLLLIAFAQLPASAQITAAGNALFFDGTGGFITNGTPTSLPPPWTASLWVNRQNSPLASAQLLTGPGAALKLEQFDTARQVGFTQFGVADFAFNYTVPTNVWTHLAFVATTANMILYVNGVATDTNANTISLPLNQFGGSVNDHLAATIDEVAVWNFARASNDIRLSYPYRTPNTMPGLALLWHFDEPTNASPSVNDDSGNGETGTLTNGVERVLSTAPIISNIFTVVSAADSGQGTLRDAVAAASLISGMDIVFSRSLSESTIALSSPLVLSNDVTIDASALPGALTLSTSSSRVFTITNGATVILNGLTFHGGFTAPTGQSALGGAIFNTGNLTLKNDVFSQISVVAGNPTSGIVPGSSGGAVYNTGTLEADECSFTGCHVTGGNAFGGAIFNANSLTINQCTFNKNSAFGGDGGVAEGGAIYSMGMATVNQSTITTNSILTGGGGGGGIYNLGTLTLFNSIVTGNSPSDFLSAFATAGFNMLSGNPQLNSPDYYGGFTETMPPLLGSPAIDAGDDSALNLFSTDQLGAPRKFGAHVDLGATEAQPIPISNFFAVVLSTNSHTGIETVELLATVLQSGRYAGSVNFQYGSTAAYGVQIPLSLVASSDRSGSINIAAQLQVSGGFLLHWNVTDAASPLIEGISPDQTFFLPPPFGSVAGDLDGDGFVSQSELDQVYSNFLTTSPFLLITNAAGLGTSNVSFSISNSVSGGYLVQSSTDLVTWSNLGPALPHYDFTDTNAPGSPTRYYRLVVP